MNQPPPYAFPNEPGYQYGQPLQPQRRKKPTLWPWILVLIVLSLCACGLFLSVIGRSARLPVQSSGTWTTTRTMPGAATKTTDAFVVTSPWKLKWSCAPHTNYFGSYNLIIHVIYDTGKTDLAVNTICNYNNTSGEVQEPDGGTVSLDIIANGEWVMTIQELE